MRLWHYDMLELLPKHLLVRQLRDCMSIASIIAEKGEITDLKCKWITDYPVNHFILYCDKVYKAILRWRVSQGCACTISDDKVQLMFSQISESSKHYNKAHLYSPVRDDKTPFPTWHNERYYKQCYYAMQELYDCGFITSEEYVIFDAACSSVIRRRHPLIFKER